MCAHSEYLQIVSYFLMFFHGNSRLCNESNQTEFKINKLFGLFVFFCGVFVFLSLMAEETNHKKYEVTGRDQMFCPSGEKT